jgi:hypothetical protein
MPSRHRPHLAPSSRLHAGFAAGALVAALTVAGCVQRSASPPAADSAVASPPPSAVVAPAEPVTDAPSPSPVVDLPHPSPAPGAATGGGSGDGATAEIARLEREARALARTEGCTDGQCRTAPVGHRACGGPRTYLAYCAATTDSAALFRKLDALARAEMEYQRKMGIGSTCEFRGPPAVRAEGGRCVLGTAGPGAGGTVPSLSVP